jgi:hypothetical protein
MFVAGSIEDNTSSSGLEAHMALDFTSAEIDPLGAIFDLPTDFDWVCRPFPL